MKSRFSNKGLVISVGLNFLFILFFIGKKIYFLTSKPNLIITEYKSTYDLNQNYFKTRNSTFIILPNDTSEIVFVGNSITEGFPLSEMFKDLRVKNRGVAGNETKDVLLRLDEILESKPKKVFIEIGINDIQEGIDLEISEVNYTKIINQIKLKSPKTIIYIQSLFPNSMSNKKNNPNIQKYNVFLKNICNSKKVVFVDLHQFFLKNNQLDSALTFDGLHLNGKGYLLWKYHIESYVYD